MENNIDLNEIGRHGYDEFRKRGVIIDKEKTDLTFKEREEIVNSLQKSILSSMKKYDEDIHKYSFMIYLYSAIICFVNDTNLNKYLSLSLKNTESVHN